MEKGSPARDALFSPFQSFVIFAILLGIVLAVFRQGFNSPMFYDSAGWIKGGAHVFARHNLLEVMGIVSVRPLLMMTFYLNYLADGMEPYYFRVVNAVVLAAAGLALTWLSLLVFRIPGLGVGGTILEKRAIAIFVGLLFTAHPLQTYVVLYIWQRGAIMACFFYFAALGTYIAARTGRFNRASPAYAATGILFLAGLFTKEILATLPVVMILAELTLFRQGFRQIIRRAIIIATITAPVMLIYFLVTPLLHGTTTVHPPGVLTRLLVYYRQSEWTPVQVAMTECRVLFRYLAMVAAPFVHGIQFIRAETISTSLWRPPVTLAACVGIIGLVGLGLAFVRRKPLCVFGVFFFFIAVAPESTLVPHYLFFGYRPILPMAGLLLILGAVILRLMQWGGSRIPERAFKPVAALILIIPLVCLGATSVSSAGKWNPLQLWKDAYSQLPRISEKFDAFPHLDIFTNLGLQLMRSDDHARAIEVFARAGAMGGPDDSDGGNTGTGRAGIVVAPEAVEQFEQAAKTHPQKAAKVLYNLGLVLHRSGDVSGGMEQLRRVIKIDPRCVIAYSNLGLALRDSGDVSAAIEQFRKVIEIDPRHAGAYNNLGASLAQLGDLRQAVKMYEKAIEIDPRLGVVHKNLGVALERSGDTAGALEHFRRAVRLDPSSSAMHIRLAIALKKGGDLKGAIEHYSKAAKLAPRSALVYNNLGHTLEMAGNLPAALQNYRRAAQLQPASVEIHFNLANALVKSGNLPRSIESYRKALKLDPDYADAHTNMGIALVSSGKFSAAIESFKRARAINGTNPKIYCGMGVALAELGKKREAVENLRKALAIKPDHAVAKRTLETLMDEIAEPRESLPGRK